VNGFRVARDGTSIYVLVSGLANMKNAPVLDAFLQAEGGPDLGTVCVDLSACAGMDSTFMGLLVGSSSGLKATGGRLVVVNPSETCLKLLDMLGVSEVLPVVPRCSSPDLTFVDLSETGQGVGMLQRMELIRRAHQALMGLNEANHDKFSAFITALEADLAKLR